VSLSCQKPFKRSPSTHQRKRLKYLQAGYFSTKIENSFPESHAWTIFLPKWITSYIE
jgi:hypothetical protein